MTVFVYGRNFRILRKLYVNRTGSQKGLTAFIREKLMPISRTNARGEIEIISETKAFELVKSLYNNWLEKRKFQTWEEIANYVDYMLYYDVGVRHCFTGSRVQGKKLHPKIDY